VKPGIHPNWYPDSIVTCACGNSWTTGSTKKEIHTDVCNKCHPFFTGEQRIVDTAGQVDRFMKRLSAKEQIAASQPVTTDKKIKQEKRRERKAGTTVSLKPVLQAPAELPLAVVDETPVVEAVQVSVVEEPIAIVAESSPVAIVETPTAQAAVEESSITAVEESSDKKLARKRTPKPKVPPATQE